jgi:hypothetical protein
MMLLSAPLPTREGLMNWYAYLAWFFAGAFFLNAVPHLVKGVSGETFPTPFATPPGRGHSSAMINTWWGLANVAAGYLLAHGVGEFSFGLNAGVAAFAAGGAFMAAMCAHHFGSLDR